jgi:hypothetical protein
VQPDGFAEGAAGFAGVADERGDRIAARQDAADDQAADMTGSADHCGGHRSPSVNLDQFKDMRSSRKNYLVELTGE